MPRENSFSDSDGRSLTPDLEEDLEAGAHNQPLDTRSPVYDNKNTPSNASRNGADANILEPALSAPSLVFAEPLAKSQSNPNANRPQSLRPTIHPAVQKFRSSVHKVIRLHRASLVIARTGIGAEPGIDPRRASAHAHFAHLRQNCSIQVIDYSRTSRVIRCMNNHDFVSLMTDAGKSDRESWVKVRWINIGGISWDVLSAAAIKYDLHPLAIEALIQQRSHARSKADYYNRHLFLRILYHSLAKKEKDAVLSSITEAPRSSSPSQMMRKEAEGADDPLHAGLDNASGKASNGYSDDVPLPEHIPTLFKRSKRRPLLSNQFQEKDLEHTTAEILVAKAQLAKLHAAQNAERRKHEQTENTIDELKRGERIDVNIEPMFIFLLRDGTVISIKKSPELAFTAPIVSRLQQSDTVLRSSADPSLLVQSLLDLVVDKALEVIDEYRIRILKLERDVLLRPNMGTVRHLHILSGDLILHKRTLAPIKTLLYGLRRYDTDRCAALVDMSKDSSATPIEGFMSQKSKIYLADVHDHMDYILTSLDMFAGIAENLIDYTFNMVSNEMNQVMRLLTTATIIFLPLTLLTGYFGMNFEFQWSVHHNSDVLFWIIALPVMAVIVPLFYYKDIKGLVHYLKKKMMAKNIKSQVYKRD